MNKILGSIFLIVFIFETTLMAGYKWEVKIDKNKHYKDAAFLVTFLCHFDDRASDIFVEFEPKLQGFHFERFDFKDQVLRAKREIYYRYLVTAQKSGKQNFSLNALMRKTTDDSIKETVLGRDNDQDIVFEDTKIQTKKMNLDILPIPKEALLVGSFDITVTYSKSSLKAYEPLQIKVEISGQGDFKRLKAFSFSLDDGKLFTQAPEIDYKLTKEGYTGKLIWSYAVTSAKDFELLEQKIAYFDAKLGVLKYLTFPQKSFKVAPLESGERLLDIKNFPQVEIEIDWKAWAVRIFYFILGVATTILFFLFRKKVKKTSKKAKKFENIAQLLEFLVKKPQYSELLISLEKDMRVKQLKSLAHYTAQLDRVDRT